MQGKCTGQVFAGHKIGNKGLPGGQVKRDGGGLDGGQYVDMPELDDVQEGEDARGQGDKQRDTLREEEDAAAIIAIGDEPADEGKGQDGDETNATDTAYGNRGPAQRLICQNSTHCCICEPTWEMIRPAQIMVKRRWRRAGGRWSMGVSRVDSWQLTLVD